MIQLLRKIFDISERDIKALMPIVEKINAYEPEIEALTDEELQAKTPYLKQQLKHGKTLDEILPEAFAVVREASRRTLGMRQFDVQMIGGIVIHQGRIAEMKTGEGKTLVAAAPVYLNALTGQGVHLVTVNDYLARRDAAWMGPIYHFLGLSLGIIQGQSQDSDELGGSYCYSLGAQSEDPRYLNLIPCSRRDAYACDIVYGTNHEFGFDYLRDNMAFEEDQLVMRELNFAIIDEVDSILIDEARTPHIISGPSNQDVSFYKSINLVVKKLEAELHFTVDKKNHSASLTEEGMDLVEEMLNIDNIASDPKIFHYVNASVKAHGLFQKDVDYVVRNGEVLIVDENTGRLMFGRRYSDGLHQALEAKEGVAVQRESQTVATITFQNLFRLYNKLAGMAGTAKTEEDEFRKIYGLDVVCIPTHKPIKREDKEDIVYKTLEGKLRGISREILRLYSKQQPVLIGTRSIEMSEVVSSRLTPEPLQKLLLLDRLYEASETRKDLSKEIKQDITALINTDLSLLKRQTMANVLAQVGIPSDPFNQENLHWFLKKFELPEASLVHLDEALKHGVPHNILNAKYHEREALIIAEAGRKGAVTVATNMAGRGVDILLGGRIADETVIQAIKAEESHSSDQHLHTEYLDTYVSYRRGGKERAAPPLPLNEQERSTLAQEIRELGGLYILGTERHESRRIDNQLRGRAGRQGDPGESRFFVSLEDHLWKIFNAKMLENPLLRSWPPMEEVNAKFLSKMILKTQERIENHFFESRKHVLEYDDVLNTQREHIYGMRREVLLGKNIRDDLKDSLKEVIKELISKGWTVSPEGREDYRCDLVYEKLNEILPFVDYMTLEEFQSKQPGEELLNQSIEIALKAYDSRIANLGEELMALIEKRVMLQIINDRWMDHLQIIDYIREGIGLRGYGQIDPLIAYKRETFDLFENTLRLIRDQSIHMVFRAQIQQQPVMQEAPMMMRVEGDEPTQASGGSSELKWPQNVDPKRVGRNDLCPCGSGKKFKSCHYPKFRESGEL